MKALTRTGSAYADISTSGNINRTGWCTRSNAKRKSRATGYVSHEKVGLVAGDIPSLGSKAAGGCLFVACARGIARGNMEIQYRIGGAEAHSACGGNPQGVGWRVAVNPEGGCDRRIARIGARSQPVDREMICAAAGRIIGTQLPVTRRKARDGT